MTAHYANSPSIHRATDILKDGGVVAYPTEAVWGLGCDPFDEQAVMRILSLKERHPRKGLILVAATMDQLDFLIHDLADEQKQLLENSWPGPNTWIVPHRDRVPWWVTGEHKGVAVRVSDHPLVQALCRRYGGPIVSTSANPQGKPAPKHRWQVLRYFRNDPRLDYVTDGAVGKRQQPSTIRDLLTGNTVRA